MPNTCTDRIHTSNIVVVSVWFDRKYSRGGFPFSRWFTARTCLGRCRSHNGESCRRRSPADTVITGWHLPGRDHNDNGRFAGKTSSYTLSTLDYVPLCICFLALRYMYLRNFSFLFICLFPDHRTKRRLYLDLFYLLFTISLDSFQRITIDTNS